MNLNTFFRLQKSISVKNPGAHFTLKFTANQDLEPMLYLVSSKISSLKFVGPKATCIATSFQGFITASVSIGFLNVSLDSSLLLRLNFDCLPGIVVSTYLWQMAVSLMAYKTTAKKCSILYIFCRCLVA